MKCLRQSLEHSRFLVRSAKWEQPTLRVSCQGMHLSLNRADYRNSPATSWVFSGIYDRHLHDLWISPDWCNARLHPSVHSWRPPSFVFAVFHSFSHISNCSCSDLAESSPFGFASALSPQAALGLGFTRLRPTKTIKWPCRLVLRSNPETWLLV